MLKKKSLYLFFISIYILLLFSCTSMSLFHDINNATKIEYSYYKFPSALQVGETYNLSCWYQLGNSSKPDKWYRSNDLSGIIATVDNPCYIIQGKTLKVSPDPFILFTNTEGNIKIRRSGDSNDYEIKVDAILVRVSFVFDGKSGEEPISGPGKRGENGKDLELEIAHYSTKDTKLENEGDLIIVADKVSKKYWLIPENESTLQFSSRGGNGGNGSDGPSRYRSSDDPVKTYGGNGYNGGNGGNGGNIKASFAVKSNLKSLFICKVDGGREGTGGNAGYGDYNGYKGYDGTPGNQGTVEVSDTSLDEMFLWITSPLFERSRLLP